jgi:hypothetical protein
MPSRYQYADAYTLEELRREYLGSDTRRRIRLLRRHVRSSDLPNGILATALRDDHVEVRQWLARHAPLSDTAREQLLKDPDSFVRACVWENPECLPYKNFAVDWATAFEGCTHLERLALMRNPQVPKELIERVFDPADSALAIDVADRHQLALAALTNETFFENMKRDAAQGQNPVPGDGSTWYRADKFLKDIWEFASAWPEEATIRHLTYLQVPAEDATKARWYQKAPTGMRGAILENCGPGDRETLELGMKDEGELGALRRRQAYATIGYLTDGELHALMSGTDADALDAACCNKSLSLHARRKLLRRLREIGHYDEPWLDDVEREIEADDENRDREKAEQDSAAGESDDIELDPDSAALEDADGDQNAKVIDNSVMYKRIAALVRRQHKFERRLNRRLTLLEAFLISIWAYAEITPTLLLFVIVATISGSIAWATLPGWMAVVTIVLTIVVLGSIAATKHEKAHSRAQKLLNLSRTMKS